MAAKKKMRATTIADNSHQVRTWTFTLAISATLLAIMYGLAFWHEARARDAAAQATISTPAR